MKQVLIKNLEDQVTHSAQFETQLAAEDWVSYHENIGSFGQKEVWETQISITEAVIDEETGEVLEPEVIVSELVKVQDAEYTVEITDITAELEVEQLKQEKIEQGRKAREACQSVLDLIAGYNLDRELTIEQITEMQTTFSSAEATLRAGRPSYAKYFIGLITADGILVTQEMKDLCLSLLGEY